MAFAVIKTGGKQYLVEAGDTVLVEKLKTSGLEEGDKITFDEVLLRDDGNGLAVGTPTVAGAAVEATLVKVGRARKVTVIHFKSKVRERKKAGHRQPYFKVKIDAIK